MSFHRNSPCAPNPRRTDRGSAIITVLILAAVTAVVAAGFLFRSAQEAKLATRSFFQAAALNLAEAGLEDGLYAANTSTLTTANGWSLVSGSTTDYIKTITTGFDYTQATGAIYIRADAATGNTPVFTATGVITIPNQATIVKQLRVAGTGPRRLFANGIVAKGTVTFSGAADIDSYDSSLGPWNAATNRSDKATVATDSTLQITGSAYIYGYVATNNSTPSVGAAGRIYGATSPGTPLVDPTRVRTDFNTNLTDATAPTGTAVSLGNVNMVGSGGDSLPAAGDVPGANGRYLYSASALSIAGGSILTITGPVDFIVTGNTTVSGSGQLVVAGTNASLNLYCPGTIALGGAGIVNTTSAPRNTTIWGTKPAGGTAQIVTVGGSGAYKGSIYAPNGNVTISGAGGLDGAVIGNTVTVSGSGVMHYDTTLATTDVVGGPNPGSGSTGSGAIAVTAWAELTGAPGSGAAFARDNRVPFATLF